MHLKIFSALSFNQTVTPACFVIPYLKDHSNASSTDLNIPQTKLSDSSVSKYRKPAEAD